MILFRHPERKLCHLQIEMQAILHQGFSVPEYFCSVVSFETKFQHKSETSMETADRLVSYLPSRQTTLTIHWHTWLYVNVKGWNPSFDVLSKVTSSQRVFNKRQGYTIKGLLKVHRQKKAGYIVFASTQKCIIQQSDSDQHLSIAVVQLLIFLQYMMKRSCKLYSIK